MNLTIVLRGPTSADLGTLCRVFTESRNLPALRSLSLLPGNAILLHFCLIVCHLTPDSLKSPQISNPPFGTAYHLSPRESVSHDSQVASAPLRIVFACHPVSGWHNQGSSNLKPQFFPLYASCLYCQEKHLPHCPSVIYHLSLILS